MRIAYSTPELTYATKMKLRSSGKIAEANLLEEALYTTPTRAKKITSAWRSSLSQKVVSYTPEEALALILDANLSREAYQKIRMGAKRRGADIYPSWKRVQKAKKRCYPLAVCHYFGKTCQSDSSGNREPHRPKNLRLQQGSFGIYFRNKSQKSGAHFKMGL